MSRLLGGISDVIDRVNALAFASCGACGAGVAQERTTPEPGFAQVFCLQPLGGDANPEAVRATQRGAKLLHEGRIEEALRELHDAKRREPSSQVVYCNLGCAYFERSDEDASLHWYREAHRLAPRGQIATLALAHLEQRAGHTDDAKWLLVNFLQEVDPSCVGALRQLSKLHQQQCSWSQAAGCLRRLQAIDPGNREWSEQLQRCLDNAGVHASLSGPGGSGYCGATAGNSRCGASDLDGSRYGSGPRRDSFNHNLSAMLAAGGQGGGAGGPQGGAGQASSIGMQDLLRQARQLKSAGHFEAAMSAYRDVLRSECTCVEALLGVADCRDELGDRQAGIEAVKQALSVAPDDAEANLRMAEFLLVSGRPSPTLETYLQRAATAVRGSKHDGEHCGDSVLRARFLRVSAEAALAKEDYKQAMVDASEAVRLDASVPQALVLLGAARLRVAEYTAALRALSAALDACGGNSSPAGMRMRAEAHSLCAQANERLRQHPQALAEAQKALDLQPQMASARIVRAQVLQQGGRTREAALELEAVLQQRPQNGTARLQLGYLQLSAGDNSAITTLEDAAINGALLSITGAAKVYLALALETQLGDRGRAAMVLREGLKEHRNLLCVWKEIERGLGTNQPSSALQRLRGICDLDLTSSQARELLLLLSNAMGRADIAHALAASMPADPRSHGSRPGSAPGSRPGSVPPNRWAPTGGFEPGGRYGGRGPAVPRANSADRRSMSPHQWRIRDGSLPRNSSYHVQDRRSVSPQPWVLPQDGSFPMQAPRMDQSTGYAAAFATPHRGNATPQRGRGRSSSPVRYSVGVR